MASESSVVELSSDITVKLHKWNSGTSRIMDTLGTQPFILCRGVVLFRRLFRTEYIIIATKIERFLECSFIKGSTVSLLEARYHYHLACNLLTLKSLATT